MRNGKGRGEGRESTELLYAANQPQHGFTGVTVENIGKRSSKKELFEFVVSGKYANLRN